MGEALLPAPVASSAFLISTLSVVLFPPPHRTSLSWADVTWAAAGQRARVGWQIGWCVGGYCPRSCLLGRERV